MKVAVIYTTNTAEGEVSQKSMQAVTAAMQNIGINFCTIPFTQNFINAIAAEKPDVVFNCIHGKYGEDGYVQTILNAMQIPYTHSGAMASQIGMNKFLTNVYAKMLGIPAMHSEAILKQRLVDGNYEVGKKSFIKPANGGSSVATFMIEAGQKLNSKQVSEVTNFYDGDLFMIEEYFQGVETGVAILNNGAVGSFQVQPAEEFYSYQAKYKSTQTQYFVPAIISPQMEERLFIDAQSLHNAIGCACISRVDFLVNGDDYRLLEINTHPGFTGSSLVPKVCKHKGIEYEEIVQILLANAKFEAV